MQKFRIDVYKGIIDEELFKSFTVECENEPMAKIIALGAITQMAKVSTVELDLFYTLTEL